MAMVEFTKDSAGEDTKVATNMISKDNENVPLDQPVDLGGQVWTLRGFMCVVCVYVYVCACVCVESMHS
jgi:hypothetical protein